MSPRVAGEDEVRCWTISSGAMAPEAAGVIHTDFERGFIKAEVCAFEDFKTLCDGKKSMAPIKVRLLLTLLVFFILF